MNVHGFIYFNDVFHELIKIALFVFTETAEITVSDGFSQKVCMKYFIAPLDYSTRLECFPTQRDIFVMCGRGKNALCGLIK